MAVDLTAGENAQGTVLLLADRRNSALKKALRKAGFQILEAFTTDHAVAVCVNNLIDAVVLDQNWFIETDGWSVAQSVKAVKPNLRVLLIVDARKTGTELPKGVDAIIPAENPAEAGAQLEQYFRPPLRLKSVAPKRNKVLRSKNPVPLKDWIKGIDSPK